MPETQQDTTGRKSEVWIEDSPGAGTYTRLYRVKSFGHPKATRDQLESTSLEDDAKTFVPGDLDFDAFNIVTNFRAGSDTDTRLNALATGEDEIGVIMIRAERGVLTQQYSFNMLVLNYGPDDAERSTVTTATASCKSTGTVTRAPYTTPPPAAA
jgi:hypothetical protein